MAEIVQADREAAREIVRGRLHRDRHHLLNAGLYGSYEEMVAAAIAATREPLERRVAELEAALEGYRAAISYVGADSWDGCSDCIDVLKAAAAVDIHRDMTPDQVAVALKRLRLHMPARKARGDA